MFRTFVCLTEQHNGWVVPLAALVCWVSCYTALRHLRQSRESQGFSRWAWLTAASFSAGAGIWSTHFIGMLGYDPGVVLAYSLRGTALSLGIVILSVAGALAALRQITRPVAAAITGAVLGLGIAAMHFSGMESVQVPGILVWDMSLAAAAVVIGCCLAAIAFAVSVRPSTFDPAVKVATLLTIATAVMHFTAMGAVEIVPDLISNEQGPALPRLALAMAIAGFMMVILGFAVMALFAERLRRMNQALRKSEAEYRLISDKTSDIIIWSELDSTRRSISPAVKDVLGYEPESWIGTRPLDFVHPDDIAGYGSVLDDLRQARTEHVTTSQRYRHANGHWVWIEASFNLTRDRDGIANGYVASLRDTTGRRMAEEALRLSEERLALALDSGSEGLWEWDLTTGRLQLPARLVELLGYADGEVAPHISSWAQLVHPEDEAPTRQALIDHLKGKAPLLKCEYRLRRHDGGYVWTMARGKVVARDGAGQALRVVGIQIDISQSKEVEQRIAHIAMHDGLTGLPNRSLFHHQLDDVLADARRRGCMFALLTCDLDRFKVVNDTLGHPAGDAVLRVVAERLRAATRANDTVARLGGDEFAIILGNLDEPLTARRMAKRLIEAVGRPITLDGCSASVGITIGIAFGPRDGDDTDTLFKNADLALYRAKAAGRNTYSAYEAGMDAAAALRSHLERDLREAVQHGGFVLHYQPVVDLASGATSGFEALLRWPHPERGMISPVDFIPLAEETGLIVSLGDWVLSEACREAAKWPDDTRIAVNVSPVQLQQRGVEQSVVQALAKSGLAPHRLEIEVTESVLIADAEATIACLHRLRALGVRVALDDFGTGYSSLSYLRLFPFDKIKIDRSFVRDIANPDTAAIVQAVVSIGGRLGRSITAEGVETQEQLEGVRREGCTEVQGYFYSKPLPAPEALAFLHSDGLRARSDDVDAGWTAETADMRAA